LGWVASAEIGWLLNIILYIISAGLILTGCYIWTELKNRHWGFMFWGLLAPVGLLGISLLKDRSLEMEQTFFKIWELDGISKTVDIDSSAKELQEILSCPTCAFFVGGEQLWCSSPESPDIQGKYCNTFRVKGSGESGK